MLRKMFATGVLLVLVLLTATCGAAAAPSGQPLDEERFNDYVGVIGGRYKIHMLLFPYDHKIVGNYFYEANGTKIELRGTYYGNDISLNEFDGKGNVIASFTGTINSDKIFRGVWQARNDNRQFNFGMQSAGTFPGKPDNVYSEAGARSTEEVEQFARELKNDILAGKKAEVAAKTAFPIRAYVDGQRVTISSEQEFIAEFDKIFYPGYVKAVAKCIPLNMHSSYRGILFGDKGQIWLNSVADEKGPDTRLRVIALNNNPKEIAYYLLD